VIDDLEAELRGVASDIQPDHHTTLKHLEGRAKLSERLKVVYICRFIYMYIYIHIYIYVYVFMYTYVCIYMYDCSIALPGICI